MEVVEEYVDPEACWTDGRCLSSDCGGNNNNDEQTEITIINIVMALRYILYCSIMHPSLLCISSVVFLFVIQSVWPNTSAVTFPSLTAGGNTGGS